MDNFLYFTEDFFSFIRAESALVYVETFLEAVLTPDDIVIM